MKEIVHSQYKNAFLWVPFIMAFGGGVYFSLDTEPTFHFPIIITLLLIGIIYKYKNIIVRAIALFLFGFFYSLCFTQIINTPQIKDSFGFVNISGVVKDIDYTTKSTHVLLQTENYIDKPVNIRLSISDDNETPMPGDIIVGNAMIFHPSPRYAPSSFDFSRHAYFSNLSGTGFFQDYKIIQHNNQLNIRQFIHNKSNSVLTDALVLGYKKVIPEDESNVWKSVGIGHVWSISGFHMTLVGGWLFALFYLLFRCFPYVTKRIPAKYPAIICAWIGLLFYLFISGISVATIRAFLMTTIIFIATISGRNILSLRNAALVFLIIFLFNPFYVMNAGFQLSFAAIFGLLWFFQDTKYIKRNRINKFFHYLYISCMTALIATIFTMPFIIAHFGYIPIYGIIGNIVILPIFSFIIMPLIMIGTICAVFGNYFFNNLADYVYHFALEIAQNISVLPHANISMPFLSNSILILYIIGFLFLIFTVKPDSKNILIKHINYVLCFGFMLIASLAYTTTTKPLFYATPDHDLVAFNVDNKLQFNKSKSSKHFFAFDSWYKMNNEIKPDKNKKYKCNHGLCFYSAEKWNLVYMKDFTTIMNNLEKICDDKDIDFIVSPFEINSEKCKAKILNDGLLIYPNKSIKKIINHRPWHNQH